MLWWEKEKRKVGKLLNTEGGDPSSTIELRTQPLLLAADFVSLLNDFADVTA